MVKERPMAWMQHVVVLLAVAHQCHGNQTPRRRRLDPILDATPASHRRITEILSEARASSSFSHPLYSQKSIRRWTIQLEATPIWICQQQDSTQTDCQEIITQQQEEMLLELGQMLPSMTLAGKVQYILNAVFVDLPLDEELPSNLPGVKHASPEEMYRVSQVQQGVLEQLGATFAHEYCLTGKGVKVGIIDTGVDYTHIALGGNGTQAAYTNAYGTSRDATENKSPDGFFPTAKVVEGKDFLGEDDTDYAEDDDPIDANGHGTAVASAVLAVAPDVTLVAVKACITAPEALCPEFALVKAIEFMLDPDQNGSLDNKADIINLSLTGAYARPYYDRTALALENAAQLGILCVTAFGNFQNIPYIAGAIGETPNVLSVGATSTPTDASSTLYMESYSARGPGEANILKPDISAPGTLPLALVGTGDQYFLTTGTSFAAPLVAGAAALLRQHCPMCDPLAIKSILMNTADRNVLYSDAEGEERMAPVTRMGSGMLRIDKALNATLWAYSLEERQPSLSFGIVDAATDVVFAKTIRIQTIASRARTLRFAYELRNASKANVMNATFVPPEVDIPAGCDYEVDVQVQIYVIADKAPNNTMTTSGFRGLDPEPLDNHEFDGHVLIQSDADQEIILPFHMIIRKAAAPVFPNGTALPFEWGPVDKNITINNEGAGIAQIDAFELIYSDPDDPEAPYGELRVDTDIRTIGYRTVPVREPGCDYTVEFSFQTWERFSHVGYQILTADIFPTDDEEDFYTIVMLGYPSVSQTFVVQGIDNSTICTGFPSDHSSNTANTIIRACSNDLQLQDSQNFTAQFRAFAFPLTLSSSFLSNVVSLTFPEPRLFAPSYDIGPYKTLKEFHVTGEISQNSYGLQLVTNSFRGWNRTGAATSTTETMLLLKKGIEIEREVTPDVIIWPGLFNQSGPTCDLALPTEKTCQAPSNGADDSDGTEDTLEVELPQQTPSPDCPPVEVPRMVVPTPEPTDAQSHFPTTETPPPVATPTQAPTVPNTAAPSIRSVPATPSSGAVSRSMLGLWLLSLVSSVFFLAC